jgi:cystathionine gamma-synthase
MDESEQTAAHIAEAGSRDFGSEVHGDTAPTAGPAAATASRRWRSTPGQDPDPDDRARSSCRSTRPRPTCSPRSAAQGATSTARSGNPTRTALETCLAALEGGRTGSPSPPGWPPRTACCAPRPARRHVVIPDDAYGGTYRLFAACSSAGGSRTRRCRCRTSTPCAAAMRPETSLIWCETPDQPAAGHRRHRRAGRDRARRRRPARVDNTFASPYLQQPLAPGADVVVHSTTKYLGGPLRRRRRRPRHPGRGFGEELAYHQNAMGGVPGAFDSWLVLRGAKTLGVRMDRHCENAARSSTCWRHPAVSPGPLPRAARPPGPRGRPPRR